MGDKKLNLKEAAEAQRALSSRLILKWDGRDVNFIAGADFSYDPEEKKIGASVVVFKIPEFEVIESSEVISEVKFPYIPGFLAFREGPAFLDAFRKLNNKPDVTLVDGNGIAHPRRMGLASFVGIVLDIPTVGCAKKPFYPFALPQERKGAYTFFRNERNDKVGFCLRTRRAVKPVFVSPGHRTDFDFAKELVLLCSKFRVPEPLREAHRRANEIFSKKL